jgi:hypothetical protein
LIVSDIALTDFAAALAMAVRCRTRFTVGVLFGAGLAAISLAVVIEDPLWIDITMTIGTATL